MLQITSQSKLCQASTLVGQQQVEKQSQSTWGPCQRSLTTMYCKRMRTRCEVFPGSGLRRVGVGPMGLMRGTVQELPVGALFQVVRQRHLINGAMRAHDGFCT